MMYLLYVQVVFGDVAMGPAIHGPFSTETECALAYDKMITDLRAANQLLPAIWKCIPFDSEAGKILS